MISDLLQRLRRRINLAASEQTLTAMEKVTQTYELLEHILTFLDEFSLRQAHLVSRHWNSMIHRSSAMEARLNPPERLRTISTFLTGVRGVGMKSLVAKFSGLTDVRTPYFHRGLSRQPVFRKAITVDGEHWMIDGISEGYIGPGEQTAFMGHALANCETFLLLYAADSRESFEQVKRWMANIQSTTEPLSQLVATPYTRRRLPRNLHPSPCLSGAVISTKNDVATSSACKDYVDPAEGAALARQLGCPLVETSATTGEGVEAAFAEMCRAYKEVRLEQLTSKSRRSSRLLLAVSPTRAVKESKARWWKRHRGRQQRA